MSLFKDLKERKYKKGYVELHNNAVLKYRFMARTFIWAGVFNFMGPIIAIIQMSNGEFDSISDIPYYFCFGSNHFIFELFTINDSFLNGNRILYIISILAIAIACSALAVFGGVLASQGKKKALLACIIYYLVDWFFIPVIYLVTGFSFQCYLAMGFHAIITIMLFLAVHYYREVINLEKRFTKVNKTEE